MKRLYARLAPWIFLLLACCVEPYPLPDVDGGKQLLVVDGFLNGTDNTCVVRLTRTINLGAKAKVYESNAFVQLKEEDGTARLLTPGAEGMYRLDGFVSDAAKKYRLTIRTASGEQYESSLVSPIATPEIDSVTWRAKPEGVLIYANTHDPANKAKYYMWRYDETWEYTAAFSSSWKFDVKDSVAVVRDMFTEDVYRCWKTQSSTSIILGSTLKLTEDVIRDAQVRSLSKTSQLFRTRYSILVKQTALSEEAYFFWTQLQKNTESMGSLFDPLPSQSLGNMTRVDDGSEPVLGFFGAGTTTEKRIFITPIELPGGYVNYDNGACGESYVELENVKFFGPNAGGYELTNAVYLGGIILIGYNYTSRECMDCKKADPEGKRTPPDFW